LGKLFSFSGKNPSQKRAGEVAQGVDPEFKLQSCKKKKKVISASKAQGQVQTPVPQNKKDN
jgi:hypothetical protein